MNGRSKKNAMHGMMRSRIADMVYILVSRNVAETGMDAIIAPMAIMARGDVIDPSISREVLTGDGMTIPVRKKQSPMIDAMRPGLSMFLSETVPLPFRMRYTPREKASSPNGILTSVT